MQRKPNCTHVYNSHCFRRERSAISGRARFTVHGEGAKGNSSPEHKHWRAMINRCHKPSDPGYPVYGARGICVCQRWRNSFLDFLTDMGRKPSPEHSLDRYPNNKGNYEPGNVRWATRKEQNRNRMGNVYFTHNGKTMLLCEWAEQAGMDAQLFTQRVHRGETGDDLFAPPHKGLRTKDLHDPTVKPYALFKGRTHKK